MSIEKRLFRGTLTGSVALVVNLGLTLLQVPFILTFWDSERYGVWLTLQAVVALLSTLDLGHHDYVGNLLNRHMAEAPNRIAGCLGSALKISLVVGSLELAAAGLFLITPSISGWLGLAQAQHSPLAWHAAFFVLIGYWVVFGCAGGLLARLYAPHGRYARATAWGVILRIAQFVAVCLCVWLSPSLLTAAIGYAAAGAAVNVAILLELRRVFPDAQPDFRNSSLAEGWRNLVRAQGFTVIGLLEQVSTNGLVLLVGRELGAAALPLFTTIRTVANVLTQGVNVLVQPLAPDLSRFHFRKEPLKLGITLEAIGTLSGAVVNLAAVVAALAAPFLYGQWTRGRLVFDETLFLLVVLAVALRCSAIGPTLFLTCTNQIRSLFFVSLWRSAVLLTGTILLLPHLGLAGVGWAMLAAELLASWGAAIVFTVGAFRLHRASFPWATHRRSLAGTALAGAAFLGAHLSPDWRIAALAAGFVACGTTAFLQLRQLADPVRARLLKFIPKKIRLFP